jgi:amidase
VPDLDLCYLSATEALARFRARTLSPVELMEAVIARAEAVDGGLNAFPLRHFDTALAAARRAEARYARGGRPRALEGLPVALKDESYVRGWPTTNGSLVLKDFVADRNSPVNERILRAGGIPHARTATPEFSCAPVTWSRLWGVTRNPWNREMTPGGSSGGAGAALAAGMTTLATGSDIGGSIRIPASACGVVGLKPAYGRNPDDPPLNLDFYNHTGPMARSVADVVLLQNVMSGPHPLDIATVRPKQMLSAAGGGVRGWNIAYSLNLGFYPIDREVEQAFQAALERFRDLGATVEEVDLGWGPWVEEAGLAWLRHSFGALLGRLLAEHADQFTTYARAFAEAGQASPAAEMVASMEAASRMYATLGPTLSRHRLLLCPTLAVPAVAAAHDPSRDAVTVAGQAVSPLLGWCLTLPFNMLSRCPVLSVPMGRARNGVPIGLQIVGRSFREPDVVRAGLAFEAAADPWYGSAATRPAP